ncbi:unnamed protein product [Paramecium pentaurelia]|uniref:Uncharacterized protein n=1 Tax=Paramecium pentaurelia TaxID=43138 RepID=A0A8S1WS21_9CILI|nr:unnamed protein product [Paramecium pentaurelia]
MQVFPSKAINKFILSGDNSPAEEEISPIKITKITESRQTADLNKSKNKRKLRKSSVQEITDELLQWKYFLDHKFQHHD